MADDVELPCALCGRPLGIEGDDQWLSIEIERENSNLLNANFCMQDHAVEWMSQPLPPREPMTVYSRTAKDRFIDGLLLAVFVVVAALLLLGVYTVVRWLGGWR